MTVATRYIVLEHRIIRPRCVPGVDWGAERIVLCRHGDRELWWHKSGKVWSARESVHSEGYLALVSGDVAGYPKKHGVLQTGGRLSRASFILNAIRIDEFFGCKIAGVLNPKHTVVIFHPEPKTTACRPPGRRTRKAEK